jgi:hypothetical protein
MTLTIYRPLWWIVESHAGYLWVDLVDWVLTGLQHKSISKFGMRESDGYSWLDIRWIRDMKGSRK